MKIAVTYEEGKVFQHFGHTEHFKFYEVEDGKVTTSQVVDTNGSGHGALAGLLAEHQVDVLICGGIGGGAQAALAEVVTADIKRINKRFIGYRKNGSLFSTSVRPGSRYKIERSDY